MSKTAPVIHELIPAEGDRNRVAKALVEEAQATFTKKQNHFDGHIVTINFFDSDRSVENTTEVKNLAETVPSKLSYVWDSLIAAIDTTASKEVSNTSSEATADVVVNGQTILTGVPAIALLSLESKLKQLRELYLTVPTTDSAIHWVPDEAAALQGTLRSASPREKLRTEKVIDHKVVYEATKEHPAQVTEFALDRNVAKSETVFFSGAVSPATKASWIKRIDALSSAVKEARQRANMAPATMVEFGAPLRDFIHNA